LAAIQLVKSYMKVSTSKTIRTELIIIALLFSLLLSSCGIENIIEAARSFPMADSETRGAAGDTPQTGDTLAETIENTPEPTPVPEDVPELVISEIMGRNEAFMMTEGNSFPDWVELYNPTGENITISGYSLYNGSEKLALDDMTIKAGEYAVIYIPDEIGGSFIPKKDANISVVTAAGTTVCEVYCEKFTQDRSLALGADGSYAVTSWSTPGAANTLEEYCAFNESRVLTGPIVVSEVVSGNIGSKKDYNYTEKTNEEPDWIEIKNISDEPIDLSEFYLSDKKSELQKYRLPEKQLYPGKYYVIGCSSEEFESELKYAPFALDSEYDKLYLSNSEGEIIDYISVKDIPRGASLGRTGSTTGVYYMSSPTSGEKNGSGCAYVCAAPTVDLPGGVYGSEPVTVAFSAETDIYYTTDGSGPGSKSNRYTEPITLSQTTVLRAIAWDGIGYPSASVTGTYVLNESYTLPVISIVTDSPEKMTNVYNLSSGANKNRTVLPGNVEFFEDGSSFNLPCGVGMSGNASLKYAKKGLSVRFRGKYGCSELDYDLFGCGATVFTGLNIRVGQDYQHDVIGNELAQDLLAGSTDRVIGQHYRYCIAYLNGQFYGLYTIVEKIDKQMIASHTGVSKDSVEIIDGPFTERSEEYRSVVQFCQKNDMTDPDNYSQLCEILDIDSYIDWLILEGYTANYDILQGNIKFYRSTEGDGKLHAIFFDLDASFRHEGDVFNNIFKTYYSNVGDSGAYNQTGLIVYSLKDNAEFRQKFLTRLSELLPGPLAIENTRKTAQELYDIVESVMEVNNRVKLIRINEEEYEKQKYLTEELLNSDYIGTVIDVVSKYFKLSDAEIEEYFGWRSIVHAN